MNFQIHNLNHEVRHYREDRLRPLPIANWEPLDRRVMSVRDVLLSFLAYGIPGVLVVAVAWTVLPA